MYIQTADGLKQIRPVETIWLILPDHVEAVECSMPADDGPLPGCDTHAKASARYMEVLHRFLVIEDARFLDPEWQNAKRVASRGMIS